MSENSDQEQWKEVQEAHHRYRGSGIALTGAIIGLCTGGFILNQKDKPALAFALSIPIANAIIQQFVDYLGRLYWARATYELFVKHREQYVLVKRASDRLFALSEGWCFLTIATFCYLLYKTVARNHFDKLTVTLAAFITIPLFLTGIIYACWWYDRRRQNPSMFMPSLILTLMIWFGNCWNRLKAKCH